MPDKNRKNIIIIFSIAILLIIISIIILIRTFVIDNKTVEQKVMNAYLNTLLLNSYECSKTIEIENIDIEGLDNSLEFNTILEVLDDININYIHKYNNKSNEVEIEFIFKIRNANITKGKLYINDEIIAVDIPFLYNKPLYITFEDLEKETEFNKLNFDKSINQIKEQLLHRDYSSIENFEANKYIDIYEAFINKILIDEIEKEKIKVDDEEIKCKKYTFKYDKQYYLSLMNNITSTIVNDSKIPKKIINNININNLSLYGYSIDVDQLEHILEGINSDYKYSIYIDSNEIIRKELGEFNVLINDDIYLKSIINLGLTLDTSYSKINSEVDISVIDISNGIDIYSLSKEEKYNLFKDINNNLYDNIYNNNMLKMIGN